jgi:hypothetical protein
LNIHRASVAALRGALALSPALAATHTVTINTVQIFGTIDPAKISDYTDYMASANLYDGLANVDSKGALVPELAEKWEVAPDAASVTFHIRPDAKFQDGSPVQAEDVVYSVERLLKINQGPANLFAGVLKPGSVEAIDAKTVKFNLSKTFSPFLATVPAIRIVNSKVVKENAGNDDGQTYLATHVASAGPYTLKSWDRGTGMTIERVPNYYRGWGEGPIDEVRFVITNDEATVRSMAASGELTMSSQYQSPDTYDALAKMPRFKIAKGETSVAFLSQAQHENGADRRSAYPQSDFARDRLRHDPRHDPAGRRIDRPVAQDLRRGASRQHAAEIRSRGCEGRDRQERLCRQVRHSAQPHLCLIGQVRGGDRAAHAVQSAADRFQGDAFRRAMEPGHGNRLEGRDDAQCHRSVFRSDIPLARLDVLYAV